MSATEPDNSFRPPRPEFCTACGEYHEIGSNTACPTTSHSTEVTMPKETTPDGAERGEGREGLADELEVFRRRYGFDLTASDVDLLARVLNQVRYGRQDGEILRREVLALRRAVCAYEAGTTFDVDQETSEAIDRAFDWHNPDGRVGSADHHLPELEAALRTPTPDPPVERRRRVIDGVECYARCLGCGEIDPCSSDCPAGVAFYPCDPSPPVEEGERGSVRDEVHRLLTDYVSEALVLGIYDKVERDLPSITDECADALTDLITAPDARQEEGDEERHLAGWQALIGWEEEGDPPDEPIWSGVHPTKEAALQASQLIAPVFRITPTDEAIRRLRAPQGEDGDA